MYGIVFNYDTTTQILTLESGSPAYKHSINSHDLYLQADLVINDNVTVVFYYNDSAITGQLTMSKVVGEDLWKLSPIPSAVFDNSGTVSVAFTIKKPIIIGGVETYTELTTVTSTFEVEATVAENIVETISLTEAENLQGQINVLDQALSDEQERLEAIIESERATITVGTTTTGEAGTDAIVTNSGDTQNAVFNFTIPRGDKGETGDTGATGATGNGIESITLIQTIGTAKTYQILFTDATTMTFVVNDGKSFNIAKEYASIVIMNADYSNPAIEIGSFVLIASTVEDPDNAKMYIKGETQYDYVSDLSGATGIQGIGITSVLKTATVGLVDTYTITFSDSSTTTFDITNGEDGADGAGNLTINNETVDNTKKYILTGAVKTDGEISADLTEYQYIFTDTEIAINGFVVDSTYTDYPFRASVALSGVTATMLGEVVFSLADSISGKFAPICETYSGGVYLYSTETNASAVTIPTIKVEVV